MSALETELQPTLHIRISYALLTFRSAYANEPNTVIDTCGRESMADKENGVRLAGFELSGGARGQRRLEFDGTVERYKGTDCSQTWATRRSAQPLRRKLGAV